MGLAITKCLNQAETNIYYDILKSINNHESYFINNYQICLKDKNGQIKYLDYENIFKWTQNLFENKNVMFTKEDFIKIKNNLNFIITFSDGYLFLIINDPKNIFIRKDYILRLIENIEHDYKEIYIKNNLAIGVFRMDSGKCKTNSEILKLQIKKYI